MGPIGCAGRLVGVGNPAPTSPPIVPYFGEGNPAPETAGGTVGGYVGMQEEPEEDA